MRCLSNKYPIPCQSDYSQMENLKDWLIKVVILNVHNDKMEHIRPLQGRRPAESQFYKPVTPSGSVKQQDHFSINM